MKKEYQKPDVEMISLMSTERIATNAVGDDSYDGEMGVESSPF